MDVVRHPFVPAPAPVRHNFEFVREVREVFVSYSMGIPAASDTLECILSVLTLQPQKCILKLNKIWEGCDGNSPLRARHSTGARRPRRRRRRPSTTGYSNFGNGSKIQKVWMEVIEYRPNRGQAHYMVYLGGAKRVVMYVPGLRPKGKPPASTSTQVSWWHSGNETPPWWWTRAGD